MWADFDVGIFVRTRRILFELRGIFHVHGSIIARFSRFQQFEDPELHQLQRLPTESVPVMAGAINRRHFPDELVADLMTFLDEEEDYWEEVHALLIENEDLSFHNTLVNRPCRTRPFTGHQLIHDILGGHPDRGYQHFRMTTTMFIRLRDELVGKGFIKGTRHLTADEQLGIFLFGVGHGVANRVLAETFQHSGETISRHFNNVLRGVVELRHDYIQLPPSNVGVHTRISENPLFHPFRKYVNFFLYMLN